MKKGSIIDAQIEFREQVKTKLGYYNYQGQLRNTPFDDIIADEVMKYWMDNKTYGVIITRPRRLSFTLPIYNNPI